MCVCVWLSGYRRRFGTPLAHPLPGYDEGYRVIIQLERVLRRLATGSDRVRKGFFLGSYRVEKRTLTVLRVGLGSVRYCFPDDVAYRVAVLSLPVIGATRVASANGESRRRPQNMRQHSQTNANAGQS